MTMLFSVRLNESMSQTRLNVNKELYKKAKYDAQKLIAGKKQEFFYKKLSGRTMKHSQIFWCVQENGKFNFQYNY